MGISDVRRVEAGENFGGRLAEPLSQDVQWDISNHWVVDTEEVGLPDDAVALLVSEDNFLDVTDLDVYPVNLCQSTFYGLRDAPVEQPVAEVTPNPAPRGGRITPPEQQETPAP
jgi:hypothetical protein